MTVPEQIPMTLGPLGGIEGVATRPTHDHRGDPKNVEELGTITGIVFGGRSSSLRDGRQEVSDTSGLIGCPRDGIKLQAGDRIVIQGVKYSVVGPRLFDYVSSVSGVGMSRYWIDVQAVV